VQRCGGVTEAAKNPRPHVNVIHFHAEFFAENGFSVAGVRIA
jgi:hypothetical protein